MLTIDQLIAKLTASKGFVSGDEVVRLDVTLEDLQRGTLAADSVSIHGETLTVETEGAGIRKRRRT